MAKRERNKKDYLTLIAAVVSIISDVVPCIIDTIKTIIGR